MNKPVGVHAIARYRERLQKVHDSMRGEENYENLWTNYPDVPAESPGDIMRDILKELEQ